MPDPLTESAGNAHRTLACEQTESARVTNSRVRPMACSLTKYREREYSSGAKGGMIDSDQTRRQNTQEICEAISRSWNFRAITRTGARPGDRRTPRAARAQSWRRAKPGSGLAPPTPG